MKESNTNFKKRRRQAYGNGRKQRGWEI